jgi:hypothetical protein
MRFKSLRLMLSIGWILSLGMLVSVASAADIKAKSGEIVARFPEEMTVKDVEQAIKDAGCEIITPLAYSPGYYRIGVLGRGITETPVLPTQEMTSAVNKLKAIPNIIAEPNYVLYYDKKQGDTIGAKFIPNDIMR